MLPSFRIKSAGRSCATAGLRTNKNNAENTIRIDSSRTATITRDEYGRQVNVESRSPEWLIVSADATTIQLRLALRRDLHSTFESRAIVCAWSTRSSLWARDLVAHATRRCSMKRKSTIYGIPSSRGYARARTHAR